MTKIYCQIQNTIVTGLTLSSYNKYVGEDIPIYSVSVTENPTNSVVYSGEGAYNEGDSVSLNVKPNLGFHFTNWVEGIDTLYGDTTYQFIATKNRDLIANFAPNTNNILIIVLPKGSGTVEQNYTVNDDVSFLAKPESGYVFVNWKEADTVVTTNQLYNFNANTNRTFVANFKVYIKIEEQSNQLKIYPNPSDKIINIPISLVNSNTLDRIFNISGKLVYDKKININNSSIDVSAFNSGIYILELKNNNLIHQQKIIIK